VPPPDHVLGNRRLADIDAKLEKFAVNPWGAQSGFATLMSRIRCRVNVGRRARNRASTHAGDQERRQPLS
jgi:hypothetical protein